MPGYQAEIGAFRLTLARQIRGIITCFRPASYPDTLPEFEKRSRLKKEDMTRTDAIARARRHLHSGDFLAELDRRVAYPTESQNSDRRDCLRAYLQYELTPPFSHLTSSPRLIEPPAVTNPY